MEDLILGERTLRENIVKIINESGLPAFIIKPILADMFTQVEKLEQQQYETALQNKQKKEDKKQCKK